MASPWFALLGTGLVTPVDLEANRAGALSAGQVELVSALRRQQVVVMAAAAVASLVLAGIWVTALTGFIAMPDVPSLVGVCVTSLLLGVAGLLEVGTFRFVRRIAADLAEGKVMTGDGTVAWGRGGYRAFTGTYRLSRLSATNTLLPGGYHLHFLPHSGVLLSGDALPSEAPAVATQAQPELLEILGQAMGFSSSDLAANQQGRLSSAQRLALLRRELAELAFAAGCCCAAVIAAEMGLGPPVAVGPFVVAAVAFLFAVLLTVGVYRGGEDAFEGGCLSVLGTVTTSQRRRRRSTSYWVEVAAKSYEVSAVAFNAVIPFHPYRVYVTAHRELLVSMEPAAGRVI